MTYDQVSQFAGTWGLVFLLALFVAVLAYAFWPGNKGKFDRAANSPLEED